MIRRGSRRRRCQSRYARQVSKSRASAFVIWASPGRTSASATSGSRGRPASDDRCAARAVVRVWIRSEVRKSRPAKGRRFRRVDRGRRSAQSRARRKPQPTEVACEAVTGSGSSGGTDRVAERRRAVALAQHYRDFEGLSIRQIADRVGRSPATVKAYFYGPSDANKRPTDSPEANNASPDRRRLLRRRGDVRAITPIGPR